MNIIVIYVSIFVAAHGALLSFALFQLRNGTTHPQRWLALLLLILSLLLITDTKSGLTILPFAEETSSVLFFLLGPVLCLYLRSIAGKKASFPYIAMQAIPAIALTLFFVSSYKFPWLYNAPWGMKAINSVYDWNWVVEAFQEATYLVICAFILAEYKKTATDFTSGTETTVATRMQYFLMLYSLLFFVDLANEIVFTVTGAGGFIHIMIPRILSALWFSAAAYFVLLMPAEYIKLQSALVSQKTSKYLRTALSAKEAEDMVNMATSKILRERLFTNSELSLAGLSEKLCVSTHELSQAINTAAGCNFSRYVNNFRIGFAKEILVSPAYKGKSVYMIALEAGFSSKSTFNRVFREICGETPTAFRQKTF